jgi:hypothetical protein
MTNEKLAQIDCTSDLPETPDLSSINDLLVEIRTAFYRLV